MARSAVIALAAFGLIGSSAPAGAESAGYVLQLVVPVTCEVSHSPLQSAAITSGAVPLGQLNEYCNASQGYELIVDYAPGTMQGAVIAVGDEQVVLNGSGRAVVSRSPGARIRNRPLSAVPGAAGFDTDRLDFRVQLI